MMLLVQQNVGTEEGEVVGTNDGIKIGVIDRDDVRISDDLNLSIIEGELDGNIDGWVNVSKDSEEKGDK